MTFSLTFHSKFSLEVSAATSSPATALPLSWIQMTSQVPWFVSVSPLRVISERCLFLVIPPTKSNDNLECTIWSNRFILMWVGRYKFRSSKTFLDSRRKPDVTKFFRSMSQLDSTNFLFWWTALTHRRRANGGAVKSRQFQECLWIGNLSED